MKKQMAMAILGISLTASISAHARDERYTLPIAGALESSDAKQIIDGPVKFYFGSQQSPQVLQKLTTTRAKGKGFLDDRADVRACNKAFVAALKNLQDRAKAVGAGANAVVNIVSYFKDNPEFSSATEFECHSGRNSAGLVLKGDVVKIADK